MDDIISWSDSCAARVSPSVSTSCLVAYYACIIPAFSQFSAVFDLEYIFKFKISVPDDKDKMTSDLICCSRQQSKY